MLPPPKPHQCSRRPDSAVLRPLPDEPFMRECLHRQQRGVAQPVQDDALQRSGEMQTRLGHVCVPIFTTVSTQSATARAEPCVAQPVRFTAVCFATVAVPVARSPPPTALPAASLWRHPSVASSVSTGSSTCSGGSGIWGPSLLQLERVGSIRATIRVGFVSSSRCQRARRAVPARERVDLGLGGADLHRADISLLCVATEAEGRRRWPCAIGSIAQ